MPITLTPSQMSWLEAEVAAGRYVSVETAVQAILAEHIVRADNDPTWDDGLVDQVRSHIAQGDADTLAAFSSFVQLRHSKVNS